MRTYIAAMLGLVVAPTMGQEIIGTGFIGGSTHTGVSGLTAGGKVLVGGSGSAVGTAYLWRAASGFEGIGTGTAMAASADGSVVVGSDWVPQAFRWTQGTGAQLLPRLTGDTFSRANAVSADGSVIAGFSTYIEHSEAPGINHAVRWTSQGIQSLGKPPARDSAVAQGISGDGSIIVGAAYNSTGTSWFDRSFRWTAATGMLDLGIPTNSSASGISADGAFIVGAFDAGGTTHAYRWTLSGGIQDLGTPPGFTHSSAGGVNADGSVIVGSATAGGEARAMLWMSRLGAVDLNAYLPTVGISLGPWTLGHATAISADGRTIAGAGKRGLNWEGWVVTLPCYANCDLSPTPPSLSPNDFMCFINRFAAGDAYANCDGSLGSPTLTANDFICFTSAYASGCS